MLQNKVYRIDDLILCNNEAKNIAIALAKTRLFNEISMQKNESKYKGYLVTNP